MKPVNFVAGKSLLLSIGCALVSASAFGQLDPDGRTLKDFLADTGAATVSAADIAGVTKSAVQNLQSTQDLVLLFRPFTSTTSKAGYGLAITPARTAFSPISGRQYRENDFIRFFSSTTLSFAESGVTIGSTSFRKLAYSIDASYYLDKSNDPILRARESFLKCPARQALEDEAFELRRAGKGAEAERKDGDASKAHVSCVNDAVKLTPWNVAKVSVSYGSGTIRPDDGNGASRSLGRRLSLNAMAGVGDNGALNLALRSTRSEIDIATINADPVFKNSSTAALRFTYGSSDNGRWRALAEVSNAKRSRGALSESVYQHAIGIDYRLVNGSWLEFRIGRSLKEDGNSSHVIGMLTLNIAATSTLKTLMSQ